MGKKRDKSEFISTFLGIKAKLFPYKNISQMAGRIFAIYCSITDQLKQKIFNETIYRIPSGNPSPL